MGQNDLRKLEQTNVSIILALLLLIDFSINVSNWPFQCWGYFCPKRKEAKIFENYLNPVMLVFIG